MIWLCRTINIYWLCMCTNETSCCVSCHKNKNKLQPQNVLLEPLHIRFYYSVINSTSPSPNTLSLTMFEVGQNLRLIEQTEIIKKSLSNLTFYCILNNCILYNEIIKFFIQKIFIVTVYTHYLSSTLLSYIWVVIYLSMYSCLYPPLAKFTFFLVHLKINIVDTLPLRCQLMYY